MLASGKLSNNWINAVFLYVKRNKEMLMPSRFVNCKQKEGERRRGKHIISPNHCQWMNFATFIYYTQGTVWSQYAWNSNYEHLNNFLCFHYEDGFVKGNHFSSVSKILRPYACSWIAMCIHTKAIYTTN